MPIEYSLLASIDEGFKGSIKKVKKVADFDALNDHSKIKYVRWFDDRKCSWTQNNGWPKEMVELYINNYSLGKFGGTADNLKILNIANNSDLKTIHFFPPNLTVIDFSKNLLKTIPELPKKLEVLICNDNKLTELPELPSTLKKLNCSVNSLIDLPAFPEGLCELICNHNELTSLPQLPDSLLDLICHNTKIKNLPVLPPNLLVLDCENCGIINLGKLPKKLTKLDCQKNSIIKLPELPDTLEILICNHNRIRVLPNMLPNMLTKLNCLCNKLTHIPPLPDGLIELICSNNSIYKIECETFPLSLTNIYIHSNKLNELPNIPTNNRIEVLHLQYNNLTKLPIGVSDIKDFIYSENPISHKILKLNLIELYELKVIDGTFDNE